MRRPRHLTQRDGSTLVVYPLRQYREHFAQRFLLLAGHRAPSDVMRRAVRMRADGVRWYDAATELAGEYLAAKLPPEVG